MTYQVKIKDYYDAFRYADNHAYDACRPSSNHMYLNGSIIKDWRKCFPTVKFVIDDTTSDDSYYSIDDVEYAEFESEEDFTLFMLRWT